MAKYEYSLSGREFVSDNRAKKLIDSAANCGLLRGDVLNANWCDLTCTGHISISMRYISCRIRFNELTRDEWLGWLNIITATSNGDENDAKALYMMLLGFDEIDSDIQTEQNYDLFAEGNVV